MYYSLTFIDPNYVKGVYQPDPGSDVRKSYDLEITRNTWDHWRIVPTERPAFAPPELHKTEVKIDGMNGVIDLSQAITGYPTFGNRTGSFDFAVVNDFRNWQEAYSDILGSVHGKRLFCVYEEDPEWYYAGRWSVGSWSTGKTRSTITLNYNLEPYKYRLYDILGDWLWDPFNFRSGTIAQRMPTECWNPYYHRVTADDLTVNDWEWIIRTNYQRFDGDETEDDGTYHGYKDRRDILTNVIGNMPVTIILSLHPDKKQDGSYEEMQIRFYNKELGIDIGGSGDYDSYTGNVNGKPIPRYIVSNFTGTNELELQVRGKGFISINFKPGRI